MRDKLRVLICGTGNAAHVFSAVASSHEHVEARVLILNAVRANEWAEIAAVSHLTATSPGELFESKGLTITSDPEVAARDCDIVIISIPSFLHLQYLEALAPYLPAGCVIAGFPGGNGFEFDVRKAFGDRYDSTLFINFESLPWICRRNEFGRTARIAGTKSRLIAAMHGDPAQARVADPIGALQELLGENPKLAITGHLLGMTLLSVNAYSHPPMMFGRWKDWNGKGLPEAPLLFEELDAETATLLGDISAEVVATSRAIMREHPHVDLSQVIPMYDWDIACYGNDIVDKTNLMTALRTNPIYAGLRHPMIRRDNGEYVPDFQHRFLSEDVPFGLVVIRGVAELAGVPTPHLDRVLRWSQDVMGREYLVGNELCGRDVAYSRAPQRYGYTLDDLLVS
ncbi:MAG TPA: NAD/NADP octopine/nopaline dehydrogenase family protein [Thermoanaerobaculia bacterium]|jgi:hypothetical protein|nr:NAD/NADP octopine/nopaline dehydrogenase family protein [Thermoanaerobaculia bacterium]